ncbi:hypothetical protein B0H14DRAFT_3439611 [Mycena olivaceomarginata]|nr:hypothetical protein B0H14DRAFT_3439611 [Mycena olivaceomarginata]
MAKAMYRRGVQIVKGMGAAMKDVPRTAQDKSRDEASLRKTASRPVTDLSTVVSTDSIPVDRSVTGLDSFSIDRAGMPSHATHPYRPSGSYAPLLPPRAPKPELDARNADTHAAHCLGLFVPFLRCKRVYETPTLSNGSKCPTSGTTTPLCLAILFAVFRFRPPTLRVASAAILIGTSHLPLPSNAPRPRPYRPTLKTQAP